MHRLTLRRPAHPSRIERHDSGVQTLPFGVAEARASAAIRSSLEKKGALIGPCGVLIAGTKKSCGATLVTRNTLEFKRVRGLVLESWFLWAHRP